MRSTASSQVRRTLRRGRHDVANSQPQHAIALARNAYTAGVASVGGPIDWIFPFKEPRGVPLLANDEGIVAIWYRLGRGEVIAVTAPAIFGNAQLRNADNLQFAYNLIAGHGEAAFDEYVHGYDNGLTAWAALPKSVHAAVWIVLAIVAISLIGGTSRSRLRIARRPGRARLVALHRGYGRAHATFAGPSAGRRGGVGGNRDFQRRKEHA